MKLQHSRQPRLVAAAVVAVVLAAAGSVAHAGGLDLSLGVTVPSVAVGIGASRPVYHESRVYYTPAPVYYAPAPVYHAPAPVYHAPAPVYYEPAPSYYVRPARVHSGATVYYTDEPHWVSKRRQPQARVTLSVQ